MGGTEDWQDVRWEQICEKEVPVRNWRGGEDELWEGYGVRCREEMIKKGAKAMI